MSLSCDESRPGVANNDAGFGSAYCRRYLSRIPPTWTRQKSKKARAGARARAWFRRECQPQKATRKHSFVTRVPLRAAAPRLTRARTRRCAGATPWLHDAFAGICGVVEAKIGSSTAVTTPGRDSTRLSDIWSLLRCFFVARDSRR